MRKAFIFAIAFFLTLTTSFSYAQSTADEIKARFINRSGAASEDRRVDEHDLKTPLGPGPKTGCHGDTLYAGVSLTNVSVAIEGNTAKITANYSGKYTRQGWVKPCVQSPPPGGREDRNVSGKITFSLKQVPFKNVELAWLGEGEFGEVADPSHDSNRLAVQAARNAVLSGI